MSFTQFCTSVQNGQIKDDLDKVFNQNGNAFSKNKGEIQKNLDFIDVDQNYHLYVWVVLIYTQIADYRDLKEFDHLQKHVAKCLDPKYVGSGKGQ
jgi:hypothetical protein